MAIVAAGIVLVLFDAPAAMAQIVQPEAEVQPGSTETTQLVTSSTEVRRAVLGLLVIAGVIGLVTILYWYKTGQQARRRFARRYGGRHLAGNGDHDVVDPDGGWATDASYQSAFAESVYAADRAEPDLGFDRDSPAPAQPVSKARPQKPTWPAQAHTDQRT
jgi:hypothetical protein